MPISALAKAKLEVMKAVPYLQKQRSAGLNYSYAGEAALLDKLHPAMVENGLTFAPTSMKVIHHEVFTTANNRPMNRVMVQVRYTLTHAPTGEHETITALGEASDTGDKATNKAMTGALKYALRQSFLIETGDDPDQTASDTQRRKTPEPTDAAPAIDAALVRTLERLYGQCRTKKDVRSVGQTVRSNLAKLSPAGREHLRTVAADLIEALPDELEENDEELPRLAAA